MSLEFGLDFKMMFLLKIYQNDNTLGISSEVIDLSINNLNNDVYVEAEVEEIFLKNCKINNIIDLSKNITQKYYFNKKGNLISSTMANRMYSKPNFNEIYHVKAIIQENRDKNITINNLCNNIEYTYSVQIKNTFGISDICYNTFELTPTKRPQPVLNLNSNSLVNQYNSKFNTNVFDVSDGEFKLTWGLSNTLNNSGGDNIQEFKIIEKNLNSNSDRKNALLYDSSSIYPDENLNEYQLSLIQCLIPELNNNITDFKSFISVILLPTKLSTAPR